MLKFIRDNTFLDEPGKPDFTLYLIVLNRPFKLDMFKDLSSRADVIICADGAANRLYDAFDEKDRDLHLPKVIIGDFDSIRPEVLVYYQDKGVKVFHNKSQSTTDMEKCVYYTFENSEALSKTAKKNSPKNALGADNYFYAKLIALGAFGGRIDQTLNSIHILYKMHTTFPEKCREIEIILMDENSMMIFLEAGVNIIHPSKTYETQGGCGIISLHGKCSLIETTGLLYNLGPKKGEMGFIEFGNFISSSNKIMGDQVIIENSDPVFWMTTLTFHDN